MTIEAADSAHVDRLLDRVRRDWITAHAGAGALGFAALALGLTLLVVLFEMFLSPSAFVRWILLAASTLVILTALIVMVIRRLLGNPSDERIALLIERRHPELHNEIINAVRLAEGSSAEADAYVRAALDESDRRAAELPPAGVVDWRGARRAAVIAGVLAAAWIALILLAPRRVANAWLRVLNPASNVAKVGRVRIVNVTPGDVTVISGDTVTVEAVIENLDYEDVTPRIESFGAEGPVRREPLVRGAPGRYTADLADIKTPRSYRITAGDSQSQRFLIRVTDRPLVTRIGAEYLFPDYTGREKEVIADTGGVIQALRGTRATVLISASKRLHAAQLHLPNEDPLLFAVAGDGVSAAARKPVLITDSSVTAIEVVDEFQCRNTRTLQITALRDQPPSVQIVSPGKDRTMGLGESLDLAIRGTDDYGVVRAELMVKRLRGSRSGESEEFRPIQTWGAFSDPRNVAVTWAWSFPADQYGQGDVIRYYVRMTDANTYDGPGVGASPEYTVRLEDAEARLREREKKFSDWQAELDKVLQMQRDVRRDTQTLSAPAPAEAAAP